MTWIRILLCLILVISKATAKSLPRILIIGDAVYRQPAAAIAKELAGKAEISRPEIRALGILSSSSALVHLDEVLGKKKWDLIFFNVGIGDLIHRAPGIESFRVMPIEQGGVRNTSDKDYAININRLAIRLKAASSKVIWINTTPIYDHHVFAKDSDVNANRIAEKIMNFHQFPILDMYQHVLSLTKNPTRSSPKWETFGSNKILIHEPIVKMIKSHCSIR